MNTIDKNDQITMKEDVEQARKIAREAHKGQKRSFSDEEYYKHPERVGEMILNETGNSTLAAAGFLHDVLEDTNCSFNDIESKVNKKVAEIVQGVTHHNESDHDDKAQAKVEAIVNNLQEAPKQSITLKLYDRFDNIKGLEKTPNHFQKRYTRETKKLIRTVKNKFALSKQQKAISNRILTTLKKQNQ